MAQPFRTLSRDELEKTLDEGPPDNQARQRGFALVDVLGQEEFRRERIPGSINIPRDHIGEFERLFEKDKKIVVYCASPECTASRETAEALTRRGFEHVFDYAGGLSDWKAADHPVEGRDAA